MSKSKRLIFFGNERLATAVATTVPTLRALIQAGYEVPLIVSNYTKPVSRKERGLEIVEVAHAYHVPVKMPEKPATIAESLREYGAAAGVLVAYGRIIPQVVIDIFPAGIINIHPSLLPNYRGPTPIETAILDNAKETGVSLMKLEAKMDAGPIYAQQKIKLSGTETKQELADRLLNLGIELLIKHLPAIIDGSIKPTSQNDKAATYTKLMQKNDGLMDLNRPAEQLERQVRAYTGWPQSRAKIAGHDAVITKAKVVKSERDGDLVVKCRPGWLEVVELKAPSGRTISGAEFIRGYSKPN